MEVQLKSAREMFEELGYKLISGDDNELINYRIDLDYNSFIQVVFNNNTKRYWSGETRKTYFDGYLRKENTPIGIDLNLHKAINKQIEELGWDE